MKNTYKLILFLSVLFLSLLLIPNFISAETTYTVDNATDLEAKVSEAETGDIISLSENIALINPIEVTGKSITINGNGYTISRNTTNWSNEGLNGTLITVGGNGATLTLTNLNLTGSARYGAQAYNGGRLILDNVTVADNEYGGILVNGGTLEIRNLTLYNNREPGEGNNGIEIGQGQDVTTTPKLIMNGTLSSTETKNVIYLSDDEGLTAFEVENAEGTVDRIYMSDNKVIVTDENNEFLFESNSNPNVDIDGTDYVENVAVTVILNDKSTVLSIKPGTLLTKEMLISRIDLEALELSNYTIADFYSDEEYTEVFNFEDPITGATTIYAKLNLIEEDETPEVPKDETPKTGDSNIVLEIAMSILAISTVAFIIKKTF